MTGGRLDERRKQQGCQASIRTRSSAPGHGEKQSGPILTLPKQIQRARGQVECW